MHLSIVCPISPCAGIGGDKWRVDCGILQPHTLGALLKDQSPTSKGGHMWGIWGDLTLLHSYSKLSNE